jgi:leader peptidase (prepilin peptidase) / N-methyltransferase
MIRIFATAFAALAGLAFGSFLNVCVTRWPAGESIVTPRSHCRNCVRKLAWWENIPIASWLALRGRCRTCSASIGWRYPLVEFAVAASWAIIAWHSLGELFAITDALSLPVSYSPRFLLGLVVTVSGKMAFTWILIGLAALDAEHLWLPNAVTLPGIGLGIALTLLRGTPILSMASLLVPVSERLLHSALAALIPAGLILLIRWTYWLIRRREGIGLGDAKLMAMLGAWLGLPGALLSFVIGVLLASIAAFVLLALPAERRGSESWVAAKLPLGTFLCIGGIVSALWGQPIIAAYMHWAGF